MTKLNFKTGIKKLVSLVMVAVMLIITMAPISSAAVEYPQGITKEQALSVIEKTDTAVTNILSQLHNTTLKELVMNQLCSSKVLSMIVPEIYKAVEANAESMSILNLSTSPAAVAAYLVNYPQVKQTLEVCPTWAEVNLTDVDWGVNDKEGFVNAVAAAFGPFNDLLYTLLCGGSYPLILVVGLNGDMGYQNAIMPILQNLGCQSITDNDTFCKDAGNDKYSMVRHILYDLFAFVEGVLDAPCNRLTDVLPGIAHFVNNNGLQNAITTLISPLRVEVLSIPLPIEIDSFVSADQVGQGFTFDINLGDMGSVTGFKTAPIDLELFASCGTVQGDTVVSDKADTFICVLRWLIETVKLNSESLVQGFGGQFDSDMIGMFNTLISKPTDDIISVLIGILNQSSALVNEYKWTFNHNTQTQVAYTQNLGQDKYQRVLDGIDELLDDFVKEGGQAKSIKEVITPEIYSNSTVSMLVKELYKVLSDEKIAEAMKLLGIDVSPAALAATLKEKQFSAAASYLANCASWSVVNEKELNWGIKSGSRRGFINAVSASFRPFERVLNMLLAGGNIRLFGSVDFYGSDGYNTAIIPVLEAFGVYIQDIPSYDEYVSKISSVDMMKPVVNSICTLIDRFAEKPVYTATEILPNLLYFVNNGGVEIIVENLMYPLSFYLDKLGISELIDTSEFTGVLNIQKIINDTMKNLDLGFALPELDINQFQGMGQLASVTSKRTMGGKQIMIYAVDSDQTAVLITLMRYLVSIMKTPGNENLLMDLVSSSGMGTGGEDDILTSYLVSLNEDINAMSVDETVEWLYDIFFAESVVVPDAPVEEYVPEIIYEEEKEVDYTVVFAIMAFIAFCEVMYLRNRNRISNYRERKKNSNKGDNPQEV